MSIHMFESPINDDDKETIVKFTIAKFDGEPAPKPAEFTRLVRWATKLERDLRAGVPGPKKFIPRPYY